MILEDTCEFNNYVEQLCCLISLLQNMPADFVFLNTDFLVNLDQIIQPSVSFRGISLIYFMLLNQQHKTPIHIVFNRKNYMPRRKKNHSLFRTMASLTDLWK